MRTKPSTHTVSLFVLGLFLLAPVYAYGMGQERMHPPSHTSGNVSDLVVYVVEPGEGPAGIEATVIVDGFGEDVAVYFGECEADVLARPSQEEIVVLVPEWCYPESWDDDDNDNDDDDYDWDDDEWDENEPVTSGVFGKWTGGNGREDYETAPKPGHAVSVTVVDFDTDLSATKNHAFTYVPDVQPAVEDIEPCSGPPGILALITVRGFSEAVAVYFGQCVAPVVERPSLDEIIVEVPTCEPVGPLTIDNYAFKASDLWVDDDEMDDWNGHDNDMYRGPAVAVTVIDLDTGVHAVKQRAFTYETDLVPIVESVDPNKGEPGMLTTVTVRGFGEAVAVYFGRCTTPLVTAPIVERPSLDEIIVEVPACPLEHPGERNNSTAEAGLTECDDSDMDWQQECSGESSWHKVCVMVVDMQTGAYAKAPHAFNYIHEPDDDDDDWDDDEYEDAVGVLAVRKVELRKGDVDVQVPILLDYHSTATDGVSTILFALAYDHDKLAITDVAVGEAAADAGKTVYWSVVEDGLLSIAVADGNEAIQQGEVCVLHGSISAEAGLGVISQLRVEELSASSPEGSEMMLDSHQGMVRVGMCYDVNSDWTVDAVDVQFVINSALHVAPQGSSEMIMSDGDGDGDVDAVDIQQVINRVLALY